MKNKKIPKDSDMDYNVKVGENLGINSKDYWCVNVNLTPEAHVDCAETAFNPMSGRKRPSTHIRTNECDH
jgi:hypothetical protein